MSIRPVVTIVFIKYHGEGVAIIGYEIYVDEYRPKESKGFMWSAPESLMISAVDIPGHVHSTLTLDIEYPLTECSLGL